MLSVCISSVFHCNTIAANNEYFTVGEAFKTIKREKNMWFANFFLWKAIEAWTRPHSLKCSHTCLTFIVINLSSCRTCLVKQNHHNFLELWWIRLWLYQCVERERAFTQVGRSGVGEKRRGMTYVHCRHINSTTAKWENWGNIQQELKCWWAMNSTKTI